MKRFLPILKKILLLLSMGTVVVIVVATLIAANQHQQTASFKKLNVDIDHHRQLFFVNEKEVKQVFNNLFPDSAKRKNANLNLKLFEQELEKMAFVEDAQIYSDMKGNVFVSIVQKQPLLRIINNNGVSYYLDINGEKLPLSNNFTPRVTVATGYIETNNNQVVDSFRLKQLFDITKFIQNDKWLWALCEQIDVLENGDMEIIPKTGKYRFIIGDASNADAKFKRMKIFYTEVLKRDTVQHNNIINLKYNNQIICTKTM